MITGDLNEIVGKLTEFGITIADKALAGLNALANKLGTSLDQLWPVLVKQEYLEGIFYAIITGILALLGGIFIIFGIRVDTDDAITGYLIGGAILIVMFVPLYHAIYHIGNPQFAALETIYSFINNFRNTQGGR